jgi:carbamoyl-phosphate synthase large subunit
MSRNRERFEAEGILLPINPHRVIETCMDKVRTAEALGLAGFAPPRYASIHRREDLVGIDFFPVVVKPSRGGGGSANCYIAQTPAQLEALGILLDLDEPDQQFMVQEYTGTPAEEYTVGVLHDLDGCFINSIAVRRILESQLNVRISVPNRTGRHELGDRLVISSGISHGYVGRFPEVTGQCEEIARALGVRGPINIQCRLVEGRVKVFEINPRFSGTTSLRAMMGYNEPDRLLGIHLLGEPIERRFRYREGLILRHLCETEIVG